MALITYQLPTSALHDQRQKIVGSMANLESSRINIANILIADKEHRQVNGFSTFPFKVNGANVANSDHVTMGHWDTAVAWNSPNNGHWICHNCHC